MLVVSAPLLAQTGDLSAASELLGPDSPFGPVDFVFAALILFGLIRGMFRGFSEELSGLIGTMIVFFGGWKFYTPVSRYFLKNTPIEDPLAAQTTAYIVMVILFLVVWNLINLVLKKLMKLAFPEQIELLGGGLVGSAKIIFILCTILLAVQLSQIEFLHTHLIRNSWFGRTTQEVVPAALHEWFPNLYPQSLVPETEGSQPPPQTEDLDTEHPDEGESYPESE